MFDDLEDVDDVRVDPKSPDEFAEQLLAAAEAGDAARERLLLSALDDGLEAAASPSSAGASGAGGSGPSGPAVRALADWLQLLLAAVEKAAERDAELPLFAWEAPGRERCGAALVRRLWRACASAELDRVQVEGGGGRGVVLVLGDCGASFSDLAAPAKWWRQQGYACVQAVRFGLRRLMVRQIDRILQALADQDVAGLGLVVHMFSEHGHYFWGHVMERWQQSPPTGLPPLADVLRGCVYDSCSSHASAVGNADRSHAVESFAKETVLRSIKRVAQRALPGSRAQAFDLSDAGRIAACVLKAYGPDSRGLRDDPIFDDFHEDWHRKALQEPHQLPRLCIFSEGDPAVFPARGVELTAEWFRAERGQHVEMLRLEGAAHCTHHLDEGVYFGRVASWLGRLSVAAASSGGAVPARAAAAAADAGPGGGAAVAGSYDEALLARSGWLLQTKVPGDGRTFPRSGCSVALAYEAFLPDGTRFDSSQSMECRIGTGQVIKAWDEAVLQMSLMQEARLICHYTHAYGEQGDPYGLPPIPAKATLIFELKLLRVG